MELKHKVWLIVSAIVALLIVVFLRLPDEGVYSPAIQRLVVVCGTTAIVLAHYREFSNRIRYWRIWRIGNNWIGYEIFLLFIAFTLWNAAENRIIQKMVAEELIATGLLWFQYVVFYLCLIAGLLMLGFVFLNGVSYKPESQKRSEELGKEQISPLEFLSQPRVFAKWLLIKHWDNTLVQGDPNIIPGEPMILKWDTLPETETVLLEVAWRRKPETKKEQEDKISWVKYTIEANFEGQIRKMSRHDIDSLRFQK